MGEIDTKPIDVQTALSFFDHTRNSPDREMEKKTELQQNLEKELANCKVQLEAKDSAYKQALLQIDHHHKKTDEISILLMNSDMEKLFYINEFEEAKARIEELESSLNQTAHQLLESEKARQQLSNEQAESFSTAEEIKRAIEREKLRTVELESQVSDAKKAAAEKETELESSANGLFKANKQIECLNQQLETVRDLENQLVEKSGLIESLRAELKQANELRLSFEKGASDAIFELNSVKEDLGLQEKKSSDQSAYIDLLETELKRLREEIACAKTESVELKESFEKLRYELEQTKERENEACFEIALLKSELHKEKSKLAEAEANESKAQREKTALYNALQQMGIEAEETKKENRTLKESISKSAGKANDEANYTDGKEAESEQEETDSIVASHERKASIENDQELAYAKKDLEFAMSKIKELRIRAEQAITRAEAAERSKAALEDQMKRKREIKERRKAALTALREESAKSSTDNIANYDVNVGNNNKRYQPLGKMLNMKF